MPSLSVSRTCATDRQDGSGARSTPEGELVSQGLPTDISSECRSIKRKGEREREEREERDRATFYSVCSIKKKKEKREKKKRENEQQQSARKEETTEEEKKRKEEEKTRESIFGQEPWPSDENTQGRVLLPPPPPEFFFSGAIRPATIFNLAPLYREGKKRDEPAVNGVR